MEGMRPSLSSGCTPQTTDFDKREVLMLAIGEFVESVDEKDNGKIIRSWWMEVLLSEQLLAMAT